MYVGTSKGTSTYWFYDFPENRRSPVYDAIQESHPRKRLVQSFLYTLILYKTPIQTYRKKQKYTHLNHHIFLRDPNSLTKNKTKMPDFGGMVWMPPPPCCHCTTSRYCYQIHAKCTYSTSFLIYYAPKPEVTAYFWYIAREWVVKVIIIKSIFVWLTASVELSVSIE